MSDISPTFKVRDIPIYGDLILSPMDGYSDYPFRSLARELGSAMSYTEFVNAIDVVYRHPFIEKKLYFTEAERPIVYQIYDDDPERILKAALKVRQNNPDIIDINMGCSAKSVSNRGAGAGLLCAPEKIGMIFSKLTKALDIPVTGKIRLGWDDLSLNYLLVARIIEENGGQLLAVHARTKAQSYGGTANWDAIAEIKQKLSIPVIGNGDVRSVADIEKMKMHTKCDGVMIGRASIGNPWIFSRLDRDNVPIETVRKTIQNHLARCLEFYGPERGLVIFRKFAKRYLNPYHLSRDQNLDLMTEVDPDKFIDQIGSMTFSLDYSIPLS
jgi:nifR3 family TIM-barrel protein